MTTSTPTPKSLFEMLDLDPTAGIDPAEVQAIKFLLERIKNQAGMVAQSHDTDETKQILNFYLQLFKLMTGKSLKEIEEFFASVMSGSSASSQPKGLGAGKSGTQDSDLQDQLNKANATIERLLRSFEHEVGINQIVVGSSPDDRKDAIVSKVTDLKTQAKQPAAPAAGSMTKEAANKLIKAVKVEADKLASSVATNKIANKPQLDKAIADAMSATS